MLPVRTVATGRTTLQFSKLKSSCIRCRSHGRRIVAAAAAIGNRNAFRVFPENSSFSIDGCLRDRIARALTHSDSLDERTATLNDLPTRFVIVATELETIARRVPPYRVRAAHRPFLIFLRTESRTQMLREFLSRKTTIRSFPRPPTRERRIPLPLFSPFFAISFVPSPPIRWRSFDERAQPERCVARAAVPENRAGRQREREQGGRSRRRQIRGQEKDAVGKRVEDEARPTPARRLW